MSRRAAHFPFFRSLNRLRAAFWRRRVAIWLARTAWLALLVPAIFLTGYLWYGWQVKWQYWFYPMLAIVLLATLWAMRPIALKKMAFRLDERLALRSQLITAYEISNTASRADNLVAHRLLHDTVNTIVDARRQVRTFSRLFWLELQVLIGVLVLLAALLLLDALNPRLPQGTVVDLPTPRPEPVAEEVIPPNPQLFPPPFAEPVQNQTMAPQQMQANLEALADALRDQAITRSTADALDRSDLGDAAQALRRLADQLGDLSAESQAGLGETLQDAADRIGDSAPELTEPLQRGSEALADADLQQAAQALEQLANALDSLQEPLPEAALAPTPEPVPPSQPEPGSDPSQVEPEQAQSSPVEQARPGGGDGASDLESIGSDQPSEAERLAVEGQPLEIESDFVLEERVLQPAALGATAVGESTADSPFARGSANTSAELGPDPLSYPWDKREIIRRYFTP